MSSHFLFFCWEDCPHPRTGCFWTKAKSLWDMSQRKSESLWMLIRRISMYLFNFFLCDAWITTTPWLPEWGKNVRNEEKKTDVPWNVRESNRFDFAGVDVGKLPSKKQQGSFLFDTIFRSHSRVLNQVSGCLLKRGFVCTGLSQLLLLIMWFSRDIHTFWIEGDCEGK